MTLFHYLKSFIQQLIKYPAPSKLNYNYNFRFFAISPVITLPEDYSSLPYYLSFDVFSQLVNVFYLFTTILIFLVPYLLFFTFKNLIEKEYRIKFILVFLFFSILFFRLPISLLILSAL